MSMSNGECEDNQNGTRYVAVTVFNFFAFLLYCHMILATIQSDLL